MTTEKLEATLNEFLHEITIIKTNWIIWNGLREEMQEGAKYEKLLEYSPCFWTVTLNNLLSKTLLGTAKLYDEHKDCLGLQKLINICDQNQTLFPKSHAIIHTNGYTGEQIPYEVQKDICANIKEAREKYQSVQNFRSQLITLRDKHLAHLDKSTFLNAKELYREVALKKEALEKLFETAAGIANSFLSCLSNNVVYTEFHNVDDYQILLTYIKEGKKAYLQRIKPRTNKKS
ncbi:MAG: hypothetical protein E7657_03790 [Ruminococcaceae bacterium]|nr:hypothetical protein [Oscillospiraceae bacterium]